MRIQLNIFALVFSRVRFVFSFLNNFRGCYAPFQPVQWCCIHVSIAKWDENRDELKKNDNIRKITKKSTKDLDLLFKKRLVFCVLKYSNILEILVESIDSAAAVAASATLQLFFRIVTHLKDLLLLLLLFDSIDMHIQIYGGFFGSSVNALDA